MSAFKDFLRPIFDHLPGWTRKAIQVQLRAPDWLTAGIVFVHVPKAAGTSFDEALYGRFMGHPHASDIRRWAPATVNALPSFSVTRNPWDRLVSAYRFARRGRGEGNTYRAGIRRPHLYQGSELENFETFVKEWLISRNISQLDNVFQPQWPFLCDRHRRILVDHVGRLEDLVPTYQFIEAHLGRVPRIGRANRSGERLEFRSFYTPELVRIVGEIYSEDIEIFGYDY